MELFRHFVSEGVDPFEVRRRVGRVSVDLEVLDLTEGNTRSHLGVDETDLVSDDCAITRAIAAAARDAGFDGVLAPAATLPGCETLAVSVGTARPRPGVPVVDLYERRSRRCSCDGVGRGDAAPG